MNTNIIIISGNIYSIGGSISCSSNVCINSNGSSSSSIWKVGRAVLQPQMAK